jgi:hypothetical protein
MKKQGFLMQLLTAVFQKLFLWLCPPKMGLSPLAARQFLVYLSVGGTDMKKTRNELCHGEQFHSTHDKIDARV